MYGRPIGNILFRIIGRSAVRRSINPENRKIAGMPRPHPVVGIAAELTDRRRRSPHQANVRINFFHEQQVLVPAEKILDFHLLSRPVEFRLALDHRNGLYHLHGAVLLRQRIVQLRQDAIRNIFEPADERHGQPRRRDLLPVGHRPETVFQVVALDGAVLLNRTETAVVIGQHQSPVGNHLSGTPAAENHDGILDRIPVDIVNILRGQSEPAGLHIFYIQLL